MSHDDASLDRGDHPDDRASDAPDAAALTARYSHALTLSYVWHRSQRRKGRDTPYLAHLMSVSALVLEAGGDEELGIAALLHDALEDAPSTAAAEARKEVIREEFGLRVMEAVEGCTDGLPDEKAEQKRGSAEERRAAWCRRKERYVAHLRGTGGHEPAHPDAVAVSLCDKLHNARSIRRDLRAAAGPDERRAFFGRFTGGREGTLWYYAALLEAYRERIGGPGTEGNAEGASVPGFADHVDALERTVDEVFELTGARREAVSGCPGR